MLNFSDIDITTPIGLMAVFTSSVLLSLHCAGMCAPLVCATLGQRSSIQHRGLWLYNLGRIISYTGMGLSVGAFTNQLASYMPQIGSLIASLIGGTLISLGIYNLFKPNLKIKQRTNIPYQVFQGIFQKIKNYLLKLPPSFRDFTLGLLTVFLPCMTLTPVLGIAAASQSALNGAILLFVFALGTLPIMMTATNVPTLTFRRIPQKLLQKASAALLLIAGIITFIRIYGH